MTVAGLLLAAGEGRRMGTPKALLTDTGPALPTDTGGAPDATGRTWAERAVGSLRGGGVGSVYVVVGARADEVRRALPPGCVVVEAQDWAEGMGASLRAGLTAVAAAEVAADAVLVMLVDTPDVGPEAVRRLAGLAAPDVLARATYHETPGHPVLLGRNHWDGILAVSHGDRGARDYLREHAPDVVAVDCSDLGTGTDADSPEDL